MADVVCVINKEKSLEILCRNIGPFDKDKNDFSILDSRIYRGRI